MGLSAPALDRRRQAATSGYPCVTLFERDPWLAALRGEGRFETLLTDLRVEREGYRRLYAELVRNLPNAEE